MFYGNPSERMVESGIAHSNKTSVTEFNYFLLYDLIVKNLSFNFGYYVTSNLGIFGILFKRTSENRLMSRVFRNVLTL